MGLGFNVGITGDKFLIERLKKEPEKATKAANLAITDATYYGWRLAKDEIGRQVNLSPGYITQNLHIIKGKAGTINRHVIKGRFRPTSLASFQPKKIGSRKGVSVKVKPGARKRIPRAFLMGLKRGKSDNGNIGLAIRVPKGEKPRKQGLAVLLYKTPIRSRNQDVYLLYGPSIDQVLRNDTVQKIIAPKVTRYLSAEFTRQYARL